MSIPHLPNLENSYLSFKKQIKYHPLYDVFSDIPKQT